MSQGDEFIKTVREVLERSGEELIAAIKSTEQYSRGREQIEELAEKIREKLEEKRLGFLVDERPKMVRWFDYETPLDVVFQAIALVVAVPVVAFCALIVLVGVYSVVVMIATNTPAAYHEANAIVKFLTGIRGYHGSEFFVGFLGAAIYGAFFFLAVESIITKEQIHLYLAMTAVGVLTFLGFGIFAPWIDAWIPPVFFVLGIIGLLTTLPGLKERVKLAERASTRMSQKEVSAKSTITLTAALSTYICGVLSIVVYFGYRFAPLYRYVGGISRSELELVLGILSVLVIAWLAAIPFFIRYNRIGYVVVAACSSAAALFLLTSSLNDPNPWGALLLVFPSIATVIGVAKLAPWYFRDQWKYGVPAEETINIRHTSARAE